MGRYRRPRVATRRNPNEVWKVCGTCGKYRPHRPRADAKTLRKKCNSCTAKDAKAWRQKNAVRAKLRSTYKGILRRCLDPRHNKYASYGAVGITVCARWQGPDGFDNFCADVGDPPSLDHTIDRIENAGHYEPGNVRWATDREQGANRRTSRQVTARDPATGLRVRHCLAEWARLTGIPAGTLRKRLALGWPARRLFDPVQERLPAGTCGVRSALGWPCDLPRGHDERGSNGSIMHANNGDGFYVREGDDG